jgi:hypothetical protein
MGSQGALGGKMASANENTKQRENRPSKHAMQSGFAVDEFASAVVRCANAEEIGRLKELARKFCFSLATAIERADKK